MTLESNQPAWRSADSDTGSRLRNSLRARIRSNRHGSWESPNRLPNAIVSRHRFRRRRRPLGAAHGVRKRLQLDAITFDTPPTEARTQVFHLKRTLRNGVALSGFKSRFITRLGYESWFGRVVIHAVLYAIAGRPVKPKPS
jgi:hypothetical protein